MVRATHDPKTVMMNADHYGNIAPAYSFVAQAVEIEVDCETGAVEVIATQLADDCGRAINPMAVHGQTSGAAVLAIGWALYEHLCIEDGALGNGNFADYALPTADSVPQIDGTLIEIPDPNGPMGAKGASETAILPGPRRLPMPSGTRWAFASPTCRSRLRKCSPVWLRKRGADMYEFVWLEPATVAEANARMAEYGDDARLIVGGTALILGLRQRMLAPTHLVSLAGIPELHGLSVEANGPLIIGALTRHCDIANSPLVRAGWPVLARMAGVLANPQVRNQGTIGGNLCYGDPSTDPPACLLALEARVEMAGPDGRRDIALNAFLMDYFETALTPDEVLIALRLPATGRRGGGHLRHRRTAAEHRPMLNLCVSADHAGRDSHAIRIALGATVPVARRVPAAEALLVGQTVAPALAAEAAEVIAGAFEMLDDQRGSAGYREQVTQVMARRHLAAIFGLAEEQARAS